VSDRLTSAMLVSALVRRAGLEGGFAAVMRRGDETSGTIVLRCLHRGVAQGLYERVPDFAVGYRLAPCGPAADAAEEDVTAYLVRRERSDPDLWILELDIADAERFAAETIC
jgi:hypothetical protein